MPTNAEAARLQMVSQQVRAWAVLEPRVLEVLTEVRREAFVPAAHRRLAFADTAIPLGDGQHMMTPQVEGRLLQALEVAPTDRVLEIGTGSGFLAACLGRLGSGVTTLEIRPALADHARRALREAGARNCEVVVADAFAWEPPGPFDCIAVTGSLPVDAARFEGWLAPGGRLFAVVGTGPAMEALRVRRAADGSLSRESLFETVLDPLDHAPRPEAFRF
jgi:protein-L-isoaspartate(D-aspartate) O-methyltransferase